MLYIASDFDGTMTSQVGGTTVGSDFYNALFDNQRKGDYRSGTLKANALAILEETFGKGDDINYNHSLAAILIQKEAVVFFRAALQNSNVQVHIITRNREDYVRLLLKFHGFPDDELQRLTIHSMKDKKGVVEKIMASNDFTKEENRLLVCDDDQKDFDNMCNGAQSLKGTSRLRGYNNQPGTFRWATMQKEMAAVVAVLDLQKMLREMRERHEMLREMHGLPPIPPMPTELPQPPANHKPPVSPKTDHVPIAEKPDWRKALSINLSNYLTDREKNKRQYATHFFCIGFGFSLYQKQQAVCALKNALEGIEFSDLTTHKKALKNGRLGQVIKAYLKQNQCSLGNNPCVKTLDELIAGLTPSADNKPTRR